MEVLTKKRRLKCWGKDESDICGTFPPTRVSARTSAFQEFFCIPQESRGSHPFYRALFHQDHERFPPAVRKGKWRSAKTHHLYFEKKK